MIAFKKSNCQQPSTSGANEYQSQVGISYTTFCSLK